MEMMLAPYTGAKADVLASGPKAKSVAGGIWLCPASGMQKVPSPKADWATCYSSQIAGTQALGNSYQGLYYHFNGEPARWAGQTMPGGAATVASYGLHPWRLLKHVPAQFHAQVPVTFCSTRGAYSNGAGCTSWHYPNGRPTAFLDGHVAVLMNKLYQGKDGAQNIFSCNAQPNIHAWAPYTSQWIWQASPYALSEY